MGYSQKCPEVDRAKTISDLVVCKISGTTYFFVCRMKVEMDKFGLHCREEEEQAHE